MAGPKRETFSQRANCYAYAVKVANPTGVGTPIPGGVTVEAGDTWQDYGNNLIVGVLTDGGNKVNRLPGGPTPVPRASEDHYLIALLASDTGFHFLRRERKKFLGSPRWKWKNGCLDTEVWLNAYDNNAGTWKTITDASFGQFVGNLGGFTCGGGYGNMHFVCFFEVQRDGFKANRVKCG
jgi:hypothetical protein